MLNLLFAENRRKLWQFAAAFAFLLFVSITTSYAQSTTFAQFLQRTGSDRNYVFTNNGSGTATFNTIPGGNPVYFFYSGISGLPSDLSGIQNATITRTSTTTALASFDAMTGNFTQSFNQTSMTQILRDSAANEGGGSRTNLLTITITQNTSTADLVGSGQAVSISASTPQQFVTFTSDFLDFTQTTSRNFSLSLSGVNPALTIGPDGLLNSFSASGTGTVASNPVPFYNPPTAAAVNIAGRVTTASGRGISRARVSFVDSNGETRTASSNSFGYYHFDGVQAGQSIVVSVNAKRYTFTPQVVQIANDLTDLNFMALE